MNPNKYRRFTFSFDAPIFRFEIPEAYEQQHRLISRTYLHSSNPAATQYNFVVDFGGQERDRNTNIIRATNFDGHAHYCGTFPGYMSNVAQVRICDAGTNNLTTDVVTGFIELDVLADDKDGFVNIMYLLAR